MEAEKSRIKAQADSISDAGLFYGIKVTPCILTQW